METVILQFLDRTGVILEAQELFSRHSLLTNPYAYLPLLALGICKNIGIRTYLVSVTGRICWGFPPLLRFVSKRTDLPLFVLHLRTEAHLLSPLQIWQLRALKS